MSGAREEASRPDAAPAGPVPPTGDDDLELAFTRALRRVATASSGAAARPGQLRHHLVTLLGPERAAALRPRLHRVVAAAEEHLPATLVSLAPITEATSARLVADLAQRRGWTVEAAHRTVLDWRDALGLAADPSVPSAPWAPSSSWPPAPPAPPPEPAPLGPPVPVGPVPGTPGPPPSWPVPRPRTVALARLTGVGARAAAHAYGGLSLRLFWVLITVLAVCAGGAAVLLPSSLPGHPNALVSGASVLAAIGLSTRLRRGLLLVTDDGLVFVGFDRRMTAPTGVPTVAAWPDVRVVDPGSGGRTAVGQVLLGTQRVQVGPEGSALLRALVGGAR